MYGHNINTNAIIFAYIIEDMEYIICESIVMDEKLDYNEYTKIDNMTYDVAYKILKSFEFDNISIIRTIK